ncbi:MAG: beta-ketoacyl synthase N-terminal-like domain-containing protein [Geobacteraceae bacterium]
MRMKAVVVESDILTPYGAGIDACWEGILANRTSISRVSRFSTKAFFSDFGGTISGLKYHGETSLVMQMISMLFDRKTTNIPSDAKLLLATIKGEIDLLEKSILTRTGDIADSTLNNLLRKVIGLTGTKGGGMVVSAACTSSAVAAARAAAIVRNGHANCVLVVACDGVSEFIFSGFSSLMALDKIPARPFDKNRMGLSVGEAAAYMLIMSEERAAREKRTIIGEISGWGISDDANHMTGPSRESEGLVRAINAALDSAGITANQVDFISAHGTGTPFNDAMEMRAFHTVFEDRNVPVYSIKGGIGHTMGAAGLVEIAIAQRVQREKVVPLTVNLKEADEDSIGWVADRHRDIGPNSIALVTNAGFSGINTALVLV